MGDFKLNRFNPIVWLAVIYYKVDNWWSMNQYERDCKQAEKMRKKLDKEYYSDHKK